MLTQNLSKIFLLLATVFVFVNMQITKMNQDATIAALTAELTELKASVPMNEPIAVVEETTEDVNFLAEVIVTPTTVEQHADEIYQHQIESDFDLFLAALIKKESEGYTKIKGDGGSAVGILQISAIYIKELNRLNGYEKYTLTDREDPLKSIAMVKEMNEFYNPTMDIDKAIKLHNPKAPPYYKKKILEFMSNLKKETNNGLS